MKNVFLMATVALTFTIQAKAEFSDEHQCSKVQAIEEHETTTDIVLKPVRIVMDKAGETYKTKLSMAKFAKTKKLKLCRNNYSGNFVILEK